MSAKALTYAEVKLGVHKVYDEVQQHLSDLDGLIADLDKAQDQRRQLDEDYSDREVEMIGEMRGAHPNMSDTGFKSHMKEWERNDSKLRVLRGQLNGVRSVIQGLEYDADILKLRVRVGSSRLEELGGYLHYLAAVKNADLQIQADKQTKMTEEKTE